MEQTSEIKQEKKNRNVYFKEYMRKRYNENNETGKDISKTYYYIRKGDATLEEKKIYGEHLVYVIKAKKALDTLKEKNPEHLLTLLKNYITTENDC